MKELGNLGQIDSHRVAQYCLCLAVSIQNCIYHLQRKLLDQYAIQVIQPNVNQCDLDFSFNLDPPPSVTAFAMEKSAFY